MNVTWVMQNNMGQHSDIHEYIEGVKKSGATVIEVQYIPFSQELPKLDGLSGPIIFYGSVEFINQVQATGNFPMGVFASLETFTYENWAKHYGNLLLNSPDGVELTTIEKFALTQRPDDEDIFARPQHDTKSLVGKVYPVKEFKAWCQDVCKGGYAGVDGKTPIVIAKPYAIEAEWRIFVVDGKIAGASQYYKKGRLCKSEGAPEDVLQFAQKAIEKWNPAPAYVLDVCHSAGNCFIVEAQGFNSAGHYKADIEKVACAINEMMIELYSQKSKKLKF